MLLAVSHAFHLSVLLPCSFAFPPKTLWESAAIGAVTVISSFVLLHWESREGCAYLRVWKIYTCSGCWRNGYVEDGLLTVTLQSGRKWIVSTHAHLSAHMLRWVLLTLETPSSIHKYLNLWVQWTQPASNFKPILFVERFKAVACLCVDVLVRKISLNLHRVSS